LILDASAAVDATLRLEPQASWVESQLDGIELVRAPHVIDAEVLGTIRRYVLYGLVDAEAGAQALDDYHSLRLVRYPAKPLLWRAWELRHNLTAADALYVALAESLGAVLLTTDRALARGPALEIEIRSFA
jgi:predicted nucleic acid-binding protein